MATITEDFVSFETAKLLKEKNCPDFGYSCIYDSEGNEAQTQSIIMKWLREVHNIDIIPFHEKLPNDCYWCRIEKYPYTEYNQDPIYKKYEESLNAAIKYCLENLI